MSHYSRELHNMLKKTIMRATRIHTHTKLGAVGARLDFVSLDVLQRLDAQPMTLKDLGRECDLGRADLQKYVTYLLKVGLVQKQVHNDDKRSVWLSISELGKTQLEGAENQFQGAIQFAMSDMSLNDERTVLKYLSRLHQGLKHLEETSERPLK